MGEMFMDAQGQAAADAVVAAPDLPEIFTPRESDVVDKGIDRKLRFSDDLFEVFPVFEVAFAVGFVSMAS